MIRELQTISPQIDGQAPSEGCKWGQIKSAIGPCVDPWIESMTGLRFLRLFVRDRGRKRRLAHGLSRVGWISDNAELAFAQGILTLNTCSVADSTKKDSASAEGKYIHKNGPMERSNTPNRSNAPKYAQVDRPFTRYLSMYLYLQSSTQSTEPRSQQTHSKTSIPTSSTQSPPSISSSQGHPWIPGFIPKLPFKITGIFRPSSHHNVLPPMLRFHRAAPHVSRE
ncbi:uncharacterized protein BO66DRAFT_403110 [Aspergillus aculeatinus CBS 121060]|uniref:Uncharacterized protein n=1 Tax=Aspergillus aculeatinus CBS 121060 TaxID=1448322 RepID=A0ACD1H4N3_9EURO|nr:hypothetical protein BO66DRAFT_403110 [Aspergillus aculeatinus CBS 121060]RAH68376.1 hypothetical protein BO66DRAFT_403110 [Aspergillus aculeatinus CBS 121060]